MKNVTHSQSHTLTYTNTMNFYVDTNISPIISTHVTLSQKHKSSIYQMLGVNKYISRLANDTRVPVIHINSQQSNPSFIVMTSQIPSSGVNESSLSKYYSFLKQLGLTHVHVNTTIHYKIHHTNVRCKTYIVFLVFYYSNDSIL